MRSSIAPAFAALTLNLAAFVGLAIASSRVEAASVTVINTPAQPVPVAGTLGVDVLTTPPARSGTVSFSCTFHPGLYACTSSGGAVTAPVGTALRITSVTGSAVYHCANSVRGYAVLRTYVQDAIAGASRSHWMYLQGVTYPLETPSGPKSNVLLEYGGTALVRKIDHVQFLFEKPTMSSSCGYNASGQVHVAFDIVPAGD